MGIEPELSLQDRPGSLVRARERAAVAAVPSGKKTFLLLCDSPVNFPPANWPVRMLL
jgi:hypothetical protein